MGILSTLSTDLAAAVASVADKVVRVEGRRRLPASGIIWSPDGLVVTANHVLTSDENIGVGLSDGTLVQATLVGRDPTTDLALLRIDTKTATPAVWTGAEELRVGHIVLVLGRPGKTVRAAMGIIQRPRRSLADGGGGRHRPLPAGRYIVLPGVLRGAAGYGGRQGDRHEHRRGSSGIPRSPCPRPRCGRSLTNC